MIRDAAGATRTEGLEAAVAESRRRAGGLREGVDGRRRVRAIAEC